MLNNLISYVNSHYPILYLTTFEEHDADALIRDLAKSDNRQVFEWNLAQGVVDFDTKQAMTTYMDLASALELWLLDELLGHFLVLKDVHLALRDSSVAVARLKALANKIVHNDNTLATFFLVSSQCYVPPELEKFVTLFELPLPDMAGIRQIVREYTDFYETDVLEPDLDELVLAFRGLSKHEIIHLLNRAYQQDGCINAAKVELVTTEKEQIIKKSGILEMVTVRERLEDIGGLHRLKQWLQQKASVLERLTEAEKFGVTPPKGLMVVGMPGCGKSLTAKAAAALFKLPLLRLDVGSLMGKYVGESEANMRRALTLAEAVSPCVLWVDELEKAFVGVGRNGGEGSEVSSRLFGYFLSWMQEKTGAVFVLATANDISVLPPELMRKGRFDEIFFVDFPNEQEREEIFRVHLQRRKQLNNAIDLKALAKHTAPDKKWLALQQAVSKRILRREQGWYFHQSEKPTNGDAGKYQNEIDLSFLFSDWLEGKGQDAQFKETAFNGCFSGGDIEAVVNEAVEQAFVDGGASLDTQRILKVLDSTSPLGAIMADKVANYVYTFHKMKLRRAT